MNARVLLPVAGLLLLAVALWLALAGRDGGFALEDPVAGPGAESPDAPTPQNATPSPEARNEARTDGAPEDPGAGAPEDSATGAPSARPETTTAGSDDDDSGTVDPADRTDADPSLVFSPDRDGIRGAVDESLPQIKECYEGWLRARPDLSGRVLVQFVIAASPEEPAFAEIRDVTLLDSELGHT